MRAPHDCLEPMLVTLTERTDTFPLYQHAGTELLFMITGKMEYCYGGSRYCSRRATPFSSSARSRTVPAS